MANKNNLIISQFEKLVDLIKYDMDSAPSRKDSLRHSFRLRQILNVINILKKYPQPIRSGAQLQHLKGIGKGTVSRIDEILATGRLSELSKKIPSKYLSSVDELEQVYGIGRKTAYTLVTKFHISSVHQLIQKYIDGDIILNDQIAIGLKYYGVYQQNIPRSEISSIDSFLQRYISAHIPLLRTIICGSYRRLKPISNDIDILIVHPHVITLSDLETSHPNYLVKVISLLKNNKFIVDDITFYNYHTKYMGFCKLHKNPVRRIDIRYVPYESFYPALLHFTGSGNFNRKIRSLAIELGYFLNEYGIYKVSPINNRKLRIPVSSEKDIFLLLGLEFLSPDKR